jgi:hypothetical protein
MFFVQILTHHCEPKAKQSSLPPDCHGASRLAMTRFPDYLCKYLNRKCSSVFVPASGNMDGKCRFRGAIPKFRAGPCPARLIRERPHRVLASDRPQKD